jgi:N-acetylmuramoyl-L-alanine amidase
MTNVMRRLAALSVLGLVGCGSAPLIDRSLGTPHQASRARYLVLHYTVSDTAESLRTFTGQTEREVSVHYLVTDEAHPRIFGLVDESRVAYHGGFGAWKNEANMNYGSIGIELVNHGWVDGPDGPVWAPFPQRQIDVLMPLIKDIVARHQIAPTNILAHSDIDPQRKQDPGVLFPWQRLVDAGLMAWPDGATVARKTREYETALPALAWFQQKLAQLGYAVAQDGVADEATRRVIVAFQTKYRPRRIDGVPDAETAALLDSPMRVKAPAAVP